MNAANIDASILRFFRDDVGGILITDAAGNFLYTDEHTAFIRDGGTNWKTACPPPRPDQKKEVWDLLYTHDGQSFMVISSSFDDGDGLKQIHFLADTSLYISLFRDISEYSRSLKVEKDHDGLTGLFNRGKFMEMKHSLFANQETIAVFNLDVNDLKRVNDAQGHAAGDALIRKAAESLKQIEARNVIPFRVGGDEFMVIAMHVTREEAENIRLRWEEALAVLNRKPDGIPCVVACGFAFGEKGFDLEEVLSFADRRMYENKKVLKQTYGDGSR